MTSAPVAAPDASLPLRARPPQVLLGVGGVLLVSAGAAVASTYGGTPIRLVLLAVAAAVTGFSLRSARARLRSSEETLAASAAGLAVASSDLGVPVLGGDPVTPFALATVFLLLHRAAPTTAAWPLAHGRPGSSPCCGRWTGCRPICAPRPASASPWSGSASPSTDAGWWRASR